MTKGIKKPRRLTWMVFSTFALCAAIVWSFELVSGSASTQGATIDQVALAKCLSQQKGNCEAQVPGLAECMAELRVDCNQAAYADRKASYGPLQPENPSMTEAEAISAALRIGNAPSSAPVSARQMSLSEYAQLMAEVPDPAISPGRLVWVVTVHSPMWTDGIPQHPGVLKQAYTVVFDATSKQGIEMCIGCALLSSK